MGHRGPVRRKMINLSRRMGPLVRKFWTSQMAQFFVSNGCEYVLPCFLAEILKIKKNYLRLIKMGCTKMQMIIQDRGKAYLTMTLTVQQHLTIRLRKTHKYVLKIVKK